MDSLPQFSARVTLPPPQISWRAALVGLFAAALLLRLWGNLYGLPALYAADEAEKTNIALRYADARQFQMYTQPALLLHALAVTNALAEYSVPLLGRIFPQLSSGTPEQRVLACRIWLGRCLMAFASAATVLAVAGLGRVVAGRLAGLCGAAICALAPLPIAAASHLKEDTPLTLMVTLALLFACRHLKTAGPPSALLAGAFAGLAAGTKYAGALVLLPVLLAILRTAPDPHASRGLAMRALACALAAFLLANPMMLLHPIRFVRGVVHQLTYLHTGHWDQIAVSPWDFGFTFYLRESLLPGLTPLILVLAAVGLLLLWRRSRPAAAILGAWILGYLLLAESAHAKPYPFFSRYLLPVVPALCALAGVGAAALVRRVRNANVPFPFRAGAAAVLTWLLLHFIVVTALHLAALRNDTRDQASRWITAHLPRGATLLVTAYTPDFDHGIYHVRMATRARVEQARREAAPGSAYLVLSSFYIDCHLRHPESVPLTTAFFQDALTRNRLVARFAAPAGPLGFHNPEILVLEIRPAPPNPSTLQATAHLWQDQGFQPTRRVGATCCSIGFDSGHGPGFAGASFQTVHHTPSAAALHTLHSAGVATANVRWQIETNRESWQASHLTFEFTSAETRLLKPSSLVLFTAQDLGSRWHPVAQQSLDLTSNTLRAKVSALGHFAIGGTRAPGVPSVDDVARVITGQSSAELDVNADGLTDAADLVLVVNTGPD